MVSKRSKPVREVHLEKEGHSNEAKSDAGTEIIAQLESEKSLHQGTGRIVDLPERGGSLPMMEHLGVTDAGDVDIGLSQCSYQL